MIVLITVIGVVAFQKLKPTVYETKAICMSGVAEYERQEQIEDLSQRTAIDLVNFLKINIDNEDYQQLSDLLGVDMEIAKSVKGIEAEQLYQQDMDEKFYALNKFEVTLVLSDNSIIEDVQDGLIYYFNNNKFIMSYYEEYKKSCNNLINDINSEIESLASFREQANSQLSLGLTNTLAGKNKSLSEIESNDIIFDIGIDTIKNISEIINLSKTLLWNGPLGFFEKDFFANGSNEVAKLIKINTQKKLLISIAGGGDTAAAIKKAKAEGKQKSKENKEEINKQKNEGNAFVCRVLEQPKIWVVGSEGDLPT